MLLNMSNHISSWYICNISTFIIYIYIYFTLIKMPCHRLNSSHFYELSYWEKSLLRKKKQNNLSLFVFDCSEQKRCDKFIIITNIMLLLWINFYRTKPNSVLGMVWYTQILSPAFSFLTPCLHETGSWKPYVMKPVHMYFQLAWNANTFYF